MTRAPRLGLLVAVAALSGACGERSPAPGASPAAGYALTVESASPGRALAAVDTRRVVVAGGALTEIAFALGVGDRVVGVDRTSIFPEAARALPSVGMFGELAAEGILALSPTVILATPEAGPAAVLEQLIAAGVDVVRVPEPNGPAEAAARVRALGDLLRVGAHGEELALALERGVEAATRRATAFHRPPRTLFVYARGTRTLLVSGLGTPAARMIALAGGENAVVGFDGFKPLTAEAVVAAAPDWILIPRRGLASVGDVDGLLALPGVAHTPAGVHRRVIAVDDLALLGFGPRAPAALAELQAAWGAAR